MRCLSFNTVQRTLWYATLLYMGGLGLIYLAGVVIILALK
jgi:hypothetical protein